MQSWDGAHVGVSSPGSRGPWGLCIFWKPWPNWLFHYRCWELNPTLPGKGQSVPWVPFHHPAHDKVTNRTLGAEGPGGGPSPLDTKALGLQN